MPGRIDASSVGKYQADILFCEATFEENGENNDGRRN